MTARLLLIGIDGASGRHLDRYSADGTLPALRALRRRGSAHPLTAPPGVSDDAQWASFLYGVGLGEHGRYHYHLPAAGGGLRDAYRAEDRPYFWNALADGGQRVAVLDIPKCAAPRPLNGRHLADWSVHGRYFREPQASPPALAAETIARFGWPQPSRCCDRQPRLDDEAVGAIAGNLLASVAQKRAAALDWLAKEPWDLFAVGFKEAHCASHAFWDFDPGHPAFDANRRERLGDPMLTVLRAIDAAIGDLAAAAAAAGVVVFTPADYQPNGSLDHLMPGIVRGLARRDIARPWRRRLRCTILPYNENCGALRVAAGVDFGAVEAEIAALRDADTGLPVVAAVTRPSSELAGAASATLPDLLVHYAPGAFPRAVVSPRLGRITATPVAMRPGNHLAGGFVIAAGEAVERHAGAVHTMADFAGLAEKALLYPVPNEGQATGFGPAFRRSTNTV